MKILITGASHGIGKAAALKMAEEGHDLVITYNKAEEEARKVKEECEKKVKVEVVQLDVRDDESIMALDTDVDVLVNNAGIAVSKPLEEQSFEEIEDQVRINVEGLIKMSKRFLGSKIINIASGAGLTGYADLTTYCATKFAVIGFTEALRKEGHDAVAVNPGMTATRMTGYSGTPPEKVAEVIVKALDSKEDLNVWDNI